MYIIMWGLYLLVVAYSMVDAYQTQLLLAVGLSELNPLLVYIGGYIGIIPPIYTVKIFWLLVLLVLLIVYTVKQTRKEINHEKCKNDDEESSVFDNITGITP